MEFERKGWTVSEFATQFAPNMTPELLINVLIEVLGQLEHWHRRGRVHGALQAASIFIHADGRVEVLGWDFSRVFPTTSESAMAESSDAERAERPTATADIASAVVTINSLMPEGLRVHPRLRRLLASAQSAPPGGAWDLRARLLDFMASMGVEGEPFFIDQFLRDPLAYVRSLTVVLAEREYREIRHLNSRGRRRQAMAELHFLLEITPVNRQALNLWRTVKQGRRRWLAHAAYGAVIILILVLSSPVILQKLQLQAPSAQAPESRSTALLIEPLEEQTLENGVHAPPRAPGAERRPSMMPADPSSIALAEASQPIRAPRGASRGPLRLELDGDAKAYIDGTPGESSSYGDGVALMLPVGPHTITVVKPGYPPAIAHFNIRPDRELTISGRVLTR